MNIGKQKKPRVRPLISSALVSAVAVLGMMNTSVCMAQPVDQAKPSKSTAASFFPLGVYWPWETTATVPVVEKEKFLTERLDDLKAHNVNLVWTTNGPDTVEELGQLCRLADSRGIKVVAGSGHWLMDTSAAREEWIPGAMSMLRKCWKELEGKPRPLAFTISDEPQPAWMDMFSQYANQVATAGIPATTVVQYFATEKALGTTGGQGLPFMAADLYPFYGSTFGPRGDTSYRFYSTYMGGFAKQAHISGVAPWAMAQVYQEIWGPARQEANGQITALAGSLQHWLMPTPAQVRWQTWASIAMGYKGVIFFTYGLTHFKADPEAKLVWQVPNVTDRDREAVLKADRPTGGTLSLVSWPQWQPGPQYKEMSSCYNELKPLVPLLQKLEPVEDTQQLVRTDKPLAGDTASLLVNRQSKQIYLAVVASPKRTQNALSLVVSQKVRRLVPVGTAPRPSGTAVALQPGQGAIYELQLDATTINKLLPEQPLVVEEDTQGLVRLEAPAIKWEQAKLLRSPATNELFLHIISSFESQAKAVALLVSSKVTRMEALSDSPRVKLKHKQGAESQKFSLALAPGQTAIYRLTIKASTTAVRN